MLIITFWWVLKSNPAGIDKISEVSLSSTISSGEEKLQLYSKTIVKLILKSLIM
jgi:hypothetical protein